MSHPTAGYAYIWQYIVRPEFTEEFENVYGPDGPWVELFSPAGGYVRTELYRDRLDPLRYLTIDYWESVEAWETFRGQRSAEFEKLDKLCSRFTLEEKRLGQLFLPDAEAG